MKSGILAIMKKELARFFGDRRMAFTTILLPGLMIFLLYTIMGNAIGNMTSVDEDFKPQAAVVSMPDSLKETLESVFTVNSIESSALEQSKEEIEQKDSQICIVFPEDFDAQVNGYDIASGESAPNIQIYYNSSDTESQVAYTSVIEVLDQYEAALTNKFDINQGGERYDLATEKDTAGTIFSSMLPMLLLIFLYSGCIAVAPESIAGEKERGTIATMLITPIKRSDIAIGKICALALIALLSGISSAVGTILSLPKLMGGAVDGLTGDVYGVTDYLMLGVVVIATVLLLITLISIISAFAKSVKEAQTAVVPLMIVVMLIGITAMFGTGAKTEFYYYLIPIYNSVQCMVGIFSFEFQAVNILIAIVSNLVYSLIGVWVLAKMFNSEKIVYSK